MPFSVFILHAWVTIPICNILGRLAQLVERLPYTQNVGSSSLSAPTKTLPLQSRSLAFDTPQFR